MVDNIHYYFPDQAIQIEFDASIISYQEILEVFFATHDPTTLNRQGYDVGSQYRSAIFYHDEVQKATVDKVISEIKGSFPSPIVTQVSMLDVFYPAEGYHLDYYNNNSSAGYCRVVIDPKIKKLRDKYSDRLKLQEV